MSTLLCLWYGNQDRTCTVRGCVEQREQHVQGKERACMFMILQFRGYSMSREVARDGRAEIVCCNLYDVREFGL